MPLVTSLLQDNIVLSDKAKDILNNSTTLKEMGLIIFFDRYAVKDKRENFALGDLVVAVSKERKGFSLEQVLAVYK